MIDTFSHFRSWIYKSGRAKDPNSSQSKLPYGNIRLKKTLEEERKERARDIAIRNERYAEMARKKEHPYDFIRRLGYDPEELGKDCSKVMNPQWRKNHPPTHPEWIVISQHSEAQPIEVPY